MAKHVDGGPAHPQTVNEIVIDKGHRIGQGNRGFDGLSVWDVTFIAALQGRLANAEITKNMVEANVDSQDAIESNVTWAAELADAAVAERARRMART